MKLWSRASPSDRLYAIVVALLTLLGVAPFWASRLLPLQDYPQFLVFVRALMDGDNPASPFHGTYTAVSWKLVPTVLPLELTRLFSYASGSIETAGKLLITLGSIGLVAASKFLLDSLGRDRWCILLVFPLLHSYWSIGGFVAFATGYPLVLVTLALAVRSLERRARRDALLFGLGCIATFLWHGLAYITLLLALAVLIACRRRTRLGEWVFDLTPVFPSVVLFLIWRFGAVPNGSHPPAAWVRPWPALEAFFGYIGPIVPHGAARFIALAGIVFIGFAAGSVSEIAESGWRVKNPFLAIVLAMLAAYFVLPESAGGVEGISNRFPYAAALFFVFAWQLPAARSTRWALLSAVGIFACGLEVDMIWRFRAFDRATLGASRLIDRMHTGESLYAYAAAGGPTAEFPGKPMIEIEQYATARHGGLPNSSFAGYGVNYVRYKTGENPMPGLKGPPVYGPGLARFDYVMLRGSLEAAHFQLVAHDGDWALYRVLR